jgi:hypothetical protein
VPDLHVDADVRLQVTTSTGETTTGRITGAGSALRVDVERPDLVLGTLNYDDVGRVADVLADAGLSVQVVGPHGPAAVIGAGASNRLGKVVTGSSAVATTPHAAGRLIATQPGVRAAAVVVPVVVVALAVLRRLRRARLRRA